MTDCTIDESAFPEPKKKEDHHSFAHRESIRLATLAADPLRNRPGWEACYWTAMQGYGFKPYHPWW